MHIDLSRYIDPSKYMVAARVREEWVAELQRKGISLHGHGTRYQTASGQSVIVKFSNERPEDTWPWWLGLPDELPNVTVFLCKSEAGELYDIVLPGSDLHKVWDVFSRSKNPVQVEFHVKKDAADRFLLGVPDDSPLDIMGYIGNYAPLR